MTNHQITSYVIRFHVAMPDSFTGETQYRIKVTHVQSNEELAFEKFDDAMEYIRLSVNDLKLSNS